MTFFEDALDRIYRKTLALSDRPQKDWIKDHLVDDLLVQIQMRADAEGE